jgi:hypothetical protein
MAILEIEIERVENPAGGGGKGLQLAAGTAKDFGKRVTWRSKPSCGNGDGRSDEVGKARVGNQIKGGNRGHDLRSEVAPSSAIGPSQPSAK